MKRATSAALILLSFFACIAERSAAQTSHKVKRIASKPTPQQIATRAQRAVVSIQAEDSEGNAIRDGSGFFVSRQRVFTNYHVIENANLIYVTSISDTDTQYPAELLFFDKERDLALLKVEGMKHGELEIEKNYRVATGDSIYVMGNPSGLLGTFSPGMISATRTIDGMDYLQFTAPASPGSSGGPVLNTAGRIIGVTVRKWRGENLNFAIPSYVLLKFVDEVAEYEATDRDFSKWLKERQQPDDGPDYSDAGIAKWKKEHPRDISPDEFFGKKERPHSDPSALRELDAALQTSLLQDGRYEGWAWNTTEKPILGDATFTIIETDHHSRRLMVAMAFSNGLCGQGTSWGILEQNSINLSGGLLCSGRALNMSSQCTIPETNTLACDYRLFSLSDFSLRDQNGRFKVTRKR